MKALFTFLLFLIINATFGQIVNVKAGVWSDPTIWSINALPTDTTDIILIYDIVIDINATCKSLNTNGHKVTVNSGVILNVTGSTDIAIDIDGNVYYTRKICNQTWTAINLNVSRYRNGDIIPQVKDTTTWNNLTTGAWCWYNNDSATYANTYGKLYNWYAVNDPRGLTPAGWHVPSDAEWSTLSTCLGGNAVAGGKMKTTGTIQAGTGLWYSPNAGATNSSGFRGLPGGTRDYNGAFDSIGLRSYWWSSTELSTDAVWYRYLSFGVANVYKNINKKQAGYSIRCVKDSSVVDVDGNVYNTIKIGTQVWMKENLKVVHYRDGSPIPDITDSAQWANDQIGAYCNFNNDLSFVSTYGRLYNWYAVNSFHNIAPTGWHVPTEAEWIVLTTYLGGDTLAAEKMKEAGNIHWIFFHDIVTTNASGFTALPAASRSYDGPFLGYVGLHCQFWSSTEYDSGNAWSLLMTNFQSKVYYGYSNKKLGLSIRCVKD